MADREKTKREENLDEIIEETDNARFHLNNARRAAERSGDKGGAQELSDEIEKVEEIRLKYIDIHDKRAG